jgi:hypothetical protein
MQLIIPTLLAALGIYLLVGLIFGVVFALAGGAGMIDPAAEEAGFGFRLLIIPGCAVFWPLLARRWAKGPPPPTEKSAHRQAASPR